MLKCLCFMIYCEKKCTFENEIMMEAKNGIAQ